MTGIIEEPALPVQRGGTSVVEQAKGVLIFRYSIDADAAYSLLELWAAEYGAAVEAIAGTVVHEICQGHRSDLSDTSLVRWLEDRLRHELPSGA